MGYHRPGRVTGAAPPSGWFRLCPRRPRVQYVDDDLHAPVASLIAGHEREVDGGPRGNLETFETAERARIRRDLHDVMGHQLSLISLKAQVAARVLRKTADIDRAVLEIELIERSARESLAKVRDYVGNMRQPDFFEGWQSAWRAGFSPGVDDGRHCI